MDSRKLYVIGNGFDLHYGLKTGTDSFVDFLKREHVFNEIDNAAEVMRGYGVCWSDFEENIAYIDFDRIEETQLQYPDYLSDHEYDRDGCILNMEMHLSSIYTAIFSALRTMVHAADTTYVPMDPEIIFDENDALISFNYTNTLKRVSCKLPMIPVFHIHGCYSQGDNLIMGYNESATMYDFEKYSAPEEGDYYLEQQLNKMLEFYRSLKKQRKELELQKYLNSIIGVDEIVVLGHSIGIVDAPYFEIMNDELRPSLWTVSFHDENDRVLDNVNQLSFRNKIFMRQW